MFVLVHKIYKKSNQRDFYFRQIPENLPVAMISYYDKGKINEKTVWLTFLDLITKGYYKLDRNAEKSDYVLTWTKGKIAEQISKKFTDGIKHV